MKPIVKNDVTYLEIQTLSWKFSTTKMHMRLNNLFNGDKTLGMWCKIITPYRLNRRLLIDYIFDATIDTVVGIRDI